MQHAEICTCRNGAIAAHLPDVWHRSRGCWLLLLRAHISLGLVTALQDQSMSVCSVSAIDLNRKQMPEVSILKFASTPTCQDLEEAMCQVLVACILQFARLRRH